RRRLRQHEHRRHHPSHRGILPAPPGVRSANRLEEGVCRPDPRGCGRICAMKTFTAAGLVVLALSQQAPGHRFTWQAQTSGVASRLRGVSAVSERVVWASGEKGTVLRTADGGATWTKLTVPDAAALDFRDVDAVSDSTAYLLSIGKGTASRIFKTTDAGAHWQKQFTN